VAGNVNFTESAKTTGSSNIMVYGPHGSGPEKLRAELNIFNADGSAKNVDVALAIFDNNYSNTIDFDDALKILNGTDNVALRMDNKILVVERRSEPVDNDTLHLFISSLRQQLYQWNIKASYMDAAGRTGFLIDKYKSSSTILNLDADNIYKFAVDGNAGSYANDRFLIVFKQVGVVPVTFTSISAVRSNANQIAVNWKVENETNIQAYSIERSIDGRGFLGIGSAAAIGNNGGSMSYTHYDDSPVSGDNFYRIKATSIGGQIQYSSIVKVAPIKVPSSISVIPNPVQNKTMQVHFAGMTEGNYQAQLFDARGLLVYSTAIAVSSSNMTKYLPMPSIIASGNYKLQVGGQDNFVTVINVLVE
jgi:hypothetical protein